jgi:putative ABC transport system permease protein
MRNTLVLLQVSVCVLFLVSAGVLLRGSRKLAQRDTRMDLAKVIGATFEPLRPQILNRLVTEPWVETIAAAWRAPLSGKLRQVAVLPSGSRDQVRAGYNFVSPQYFQTFGIPFSRGRNFSTEENRAEAPVVIVSELTAKRLWPNQDPIGQYLTLGHDALLSPGDRLPPGRTVQVIGVTGDVISGPIEDGLDATCLYFPFGSVEGRHTVLIRVKGNVKTVRSLFAAAVESVAPQSSWYYTPMEDAVDVALLPFRAASMVAWLLGGVALLLTVSGIYSVLSYVVSQRTKEIGIRMALGATSATVTRTVLGHSFKLTAAGATMGVLPALGLSKIFAANMEMIDFFDTLAYLGGIATVVSAALAAAYFPSRRAIRVDPANTLRAE